MALVVDLVVIVVVVEAFHLEGFHDGWPKVNLECWIVSHARVV